MSVQKGKFLLSFKTEVGKSWKANPSSESYVLLGTSDFLGVIMVLKVSRRMSLLLKDACSAEVKCHDACNFQMMQLTVAHIQTEKDSIAIAYSCEE